jgi:hypothetical protein
VRGDPDADLFREKGIPPRQVAGGGILRTVPGIDDEPPLRVFDEPREDLQRADPVLVAKNVELARIDALIRLPETDPRIATQIATQRRSTIRDRL